MNREQRRKQDKKMFETFKIALKHLEDATYSSSKDVCIESAIGEINDDMGREYQMVLRLVPKCDKWIGENDIQTVKILSEANA